MRIGFITCVRLGLSCMEAIYESHGTLALALTLRDDLAQTKSGRVYLDEFCAKHEIPLGKIRNVNDADAVTMIAAAELDWLFIVGWSQIAGSVVLSSVRKGVLGMHPTLLPLGRGRAPIPWTILLGMTETGVTLFKMDAGVDSGPIVAQRRITVATRETAASLYAKVDQAHADLLRTHWDALATDRLQPTPQDEQQATVWAGRKPEDGRITQEFTVAQADRMIRAVTRPYPGAFIDEPNGRLRIWASGAPGEDLGGTASQPKVRRLHFRDGWLDAYDTTTE